VRLPGSPPGGRHSHAASVNEGTTRARRDDPAARFRLAVLAVFALGIVLRLPTFGRPLLSDDEAIYATTADAMARGDLLYRDVVDHKPPLVYHVYEAGFRLFGRYDVHGAHAFVVLAVLATAAFDAYAALHQLRRDEASLDQRLKTESAELFGEAVGDPEAVSKRIKQGIKMDELPIPPATAYDLLDDISRAMPDATKVKLDVTELDIKSKKTFLKGTTDSGSAVDDIANFLAKIKCFESDKGDSVQKGPVQNVPGQQDLKQFTLTIASKCP